MPRCSVRKLTGYGDLTVRSRAIEGDWGSGLSGYVGEKCTGGSARRDVWVMHGKIRRAVAA